MARRRDNDDSPGLFGAEPPPPPPPPAPRSRGVDAPKPAEVEPAVRDLAVRVPQRIRLGTSSWSFPGWAGIVYDRDRPQSDLARRGLRAYAAHPLLRSVGIDRTFYAPISTRAFAAYASDVPDDFRFLVKAHDLLTRPTLPDGGGANPQFLDASYASSEVVAPMMAGLGHKAGPLVFQFTPLRLRGDDAARLLDRLERFLCLLPRGPLYAVEIRNRELLGHRYASILRAAGVAHCFNIHPSMPSPREQAIAIAGEAPTIEAARDAVRSQPAFVARWMLHSGFDYEGAAERYAPFTRLVDEDPASRELLAAMAAKAFLAGRDSWIIVNNKAEGSAPLTVIKLAERVAAAVALP
jgi:uncharacterized protein YecE (DUF72 family)